MALSQELLCGQASVRAQYSRKKLTKPGFRSNVALARQPWQRPDLSARQTAEWLAKEMVSPHSGQRHESCPILSPDTRIMIPSS